MNCLLHRLCLRETVQPSTRVWVAHAPTVHIRVINFTQIIVERQVLEVNTLHHHHILVTMKFLLCHQEVRHRPVQRHRHINNITNVCRQQQQRHHRRATAFLCHHRVPDVASRLSHHQMECAKACSCKDERQPITHNFLHSHCFRMDLLSPSHRRHIQSTRRWHRQATQHRFTVDRVQLKTIERVLVLESIREHRSAQQARQVQSLSRKEHPYPPSHDQYRSCQRGVHRDKRKHNIPSSCNR